MVVYLPASVRDRLRTHTGHQDGATYTDVVLDALDALHEQLEQLLAGARTGRQEGSLFQDRERLRQRHNEHQVQVTLRPARHDLAVIDRLVRDHNASSRSTPIARVLDAYLPPGA